MNPMTLSATASRASRPDDDQLEECIAEVRPPVWQLIAQAGRELVAPFWRRFRSWRSSTDLNRTTQTYRRVQLERRCRIGRATARRMCLTGTPRRLGVNPALCDGDRRLLR